MSIMHPAAAHRTLQGLHIAGSIVVDTYLISPWGTEPLFRAAVLYAVIPGWALSDI